MEKADIDNITRKILYIKKNKGFPFTADQIQELDTDMFIKSFINFCLYWKEKLKLLEQAEQYELCKEVLDVISIQETFLNEVAQLHHAVDSEGMPLFLSQIREEIIQKKNIAE